jgi:hypothetical protein
MNLKYELILQTNFAAIEKHQVVKSEQSQSSDKNGRSKSGMVLPFEPHYITFDEVSYSVDMPQVTYIYIYSNEKGLHSTLSS